MNGGTAVQPEPADGTPDHAHLHHPGTIATDGTGLSGNSWGQFAGFDGGITGFGDVYPYPGFTPSFDLSASASQATTIEADSGGPTSGSSRTIPAASVPSGDSASGLVIIPAYDTSITDLSSSDPTLFTEITAAITAAIDFYEQEIITPITITIDFGYGEVNGETLGGGDLSESLANYDAVPYGTLVAALASHAELVGLDSVAANLPSTITSAGSICYVADAELAALGLSQDISPGTTVDGWVGLSSRLPLTYPPNGRAVSGQYDAIGALEHEISEDMGRVANYGFNNFSALSLFRYTSDGILANTGNESAYFSIDGGNTNLAEFNNGSNGGDPGDWAGSVPNDSYDAFASIGAANTVSATDLTLMNVLGYTLSDTGVCFLAGTQIATPSGEVPVERLAGGDIVLTSRGNVRPIVWIGAGRVLATPGRRSAATPVTVRKGALADNVPTRDLHVTKGHSLLLDDALIPVEELVNHRSILWDDRAQEVTVYHIELETHDVLLADGAPAESYRDDGNRWLFRNGNTGWGLPPAPPCAAGTDGGADRRCGVATFVGSCRPASRFTAHMRSRSSPAGRWRSCGRRGAAPGPVCLQPCWHAGRRARCLACRDTTRAGRRARPAQPRHCVAAGHGAPRARDTGD